MNAIDHYQTMARYNRLMNEKLYAVASELSDEERKRDLGAFFRSVHGTLNHLLLADRAWLGRFTHDRAVFESLDAEGRPITLTGTLDQELYADFATLRRERARLTRPSKRSRRGSRPSGSPPPSHIGRAPVSAASTRSGGR